jgi:hypothetical protein
MPSNLVFYLTIALGCVVALALLMGTIHFSLKRHRKKLGVKEDNLPLEANYLGIKDEGQSRPVVPTLAVDTNVPQVRQFETFSPPSHTYYNKYLVPQQANIVRPSYKVFSPPPQGVIASGSPAMHCYRTMLAPTPRKDITQALPRSDTIARHPASLCPGITPPSHPVNSQNVRLLPSSHTLGSIPQAIPPTAPEPPVSFATRTIDVMGVVNPVQLYDHAKKRTIYYG